MSFLEDAIPFCKRSLSIHEAKLSEEGYVNRVLFNENEVDPGQAFIMGFYGRKDGSIIPDEDINQKSNVLIIGNSGSGKSFVLRYAYKKAAIDFLQDSESPFPIFFSFLDGLPTNLDLESGLNLESEGLFFRALSEHPLGCALFLDQLEDVLKKDSRYINNLKIFLQGNLSKISRLVITCRRAIWREEWFSNPPMEFSTYHLDYLPLETYDQIIPISEKRQAFLQECSRLRIDNLLQSPFDGFYLAREFAADRPLPHSRNECLSKRVWDALKGSDSDRQSGQSPPVERLYFLASQLACLAAFTDQVAWTEQDAIDFLGSSDCIRSQFSNGDLSVLFERPLFNKQSSRFTFSHQIYQEFLASKVLEEIPLTKQKQLLVTQNSCSHRILPIFRGVAVFLAESSQEFGQYLFDNDPMVAFLGEFPSLPIEQDELLVRTLIDDTILRHLPPWHQVPPRGDELLKAISNHRVQNPQAFLAHYLDSSDEIANLWGTACANEWGGDQSLNSSLSQLAHDNSKHTDARKWAIRAICKTGNLSDIRSLYDLIDDSQDIVRGAVLNAFRKFENPTPRDFISKLIGGRRQPDLLCELEYEAGSYGETLSLSEMEEAFLIADQNYEAIGDLIGTLLGALFKRARELFFAGIPPKLIFKVWGQSDNEIFGFLVDLKELISSNPLLFQNLWESALNHLGENQDNSDEWTVSLEFDLPKFFSESTTDEFFRLVPENDHGLTRSQIRLIENTVFAYFRREPTQERLEIFQNQIPFFSSDLQLPTARVSEPSRDVLEERQRLVDGLRDDRIPEEQVFYCLKAAAELERCSFNYRFSKEVFDRVFQRLDQLTKDRILRAFRLCIASLSYHRTWSSSSHYTSTKPIYRIPFLVLHDLGEDFQPSKLAEFISCYWSNFGEDREIGRLLLEELRTKDNSLWEQCVLKILSEPHEPYEILHYLIGINCAIYCEGCKSRLRNGDFNRHNLRILLDYWNTFTPPEHLETIRDSYLFLKDHLTTPAAQAQDETGGLIGSTQAPDQQLLPYELQFTPLLTLMSFDDPWAWGEFSSRLSREDVPLTEDFSIPYRKPGKFLFPLNSERVPILADWFALIRRRMGTTFFHADELAKSILENIIAVGGISPHRELKRLQNTIAYPGVQWLSHAILRAEDQLLSEERPNWEVTGLLNFVNRERFALINSERDLFEWVLHAVEQIKEGSEQRAEGVEGYWDADNPKTEPKCQNVLWPQIRHLLGAISIVGVEERLIGPNNCDFWVEFPRQGLPSIKIPVELKTTRVNYGSSDLVAPIELQLFKKYMQPENCGHGIFLVLWFKGGKNYRGPSKWDTPAELLDDLNSKSRSLQETYSVTIKPLVIDITKTPRMH